MEMEPEIASRRVHSLSQNSMQKLCGEANAGADAESECGMCAGATAHPCGVAACRG